MGIPPDYPFLNTRLSIILNTPVSPFLNPAENTNDFHPAD